MALGVCWDAKIYYAHVPQSVCLLNRCDLFRQAEYTKEILFEFYALKETGKSQFLKICFLLQNIAVIHSFKGISSFQALLCPRG